VTGTPDPARLEIISATPTPFTPDGDLDRVAWRACLARLAPVVDGLFVAGTTGEFPALTDGERLDLFEDALAAVGPARLVAHVGAAGTRQAVGLTRSAVAAGVVRLAAITPYYLPASERAVLTHFGRLAEAAAGTAGTSGAAMYGYLYPDRTQVGLDPAVIGELAAAGVRGLKISGAASRLVEHYVEQAPAGFSVWSGADRDLVRVARCGGAGLVSGVSSAAPWAFVALRDALAAGADQAEIAVRQQAVDAMVDTFDSIAAMKAGLAERGIAGPLCRMSVDPPDPAALGTIRRTVRAMPG
jgi:4-hydroxy-tetrahydrodipicolinate synthase